MSKKGLIYKAECVVTGKVYVGQTTHSVGKRKREHIYASNYPGHPCHETKLSRALRKYGTNNFRWTIIEDNIPKGKLVERESEYIRKLDSMDGGYNMLPGGARPSSRKRDDSRSIVSDYSKSNIDYICEHTGMRSAEAIGLCLGLFGLMVKNNVSVVKAVDADNRISSALMPCILDFKGEGDND